MEKVNTITEVKNFVECPHCNKSKNSVGHLFSENKEISFGPWYCAECGNAFRGVVKGKDVFLEKMSERKDSAIVFLRSGNILLAVKGMYFNGELDVDNSRYFYEEHTCPTNYLKDVEMVIDLKNGDTDPHGIFEFVGVIPYQDLDGVEDLRSLLPSGFLAEI